MRNLLGYVTEIGTVRIELDDDGISHFTLDGTHIAQVKSAPLGDGPHSISVLQEGFKSGQWETQPQPTQGFTVTLKPQEELERLIVEKAAAEIFATQREDLRERVISTVVRYMMNACLEQTEFRLQTEAISMRIDAMITQHLDTAFSPMLSKYAPSATFRGTLDQRITRAMEGLTPKMEGVILAAVREAAMKAYGSRIDTVLSQLDKKEI